MLTECKQNATKDQLSALGLRPSWAGQTLDLRPSWAHSHTACHTASQLVAMLMFIFFLVVVTGMGEGGEGGSSRQLARS